MERTQPNSMTFIYNIFLGILSIFFGVVLLNYVLQSQEGKRAVERATAKIDRSFCVDMAQGTYDPNGYIVKCLADAKAERKEHKFF